MEIFVNFRYGSYGEFGKLLCNVVFQGFNYIVKDVMGY